MDNEINIISFNCAGFKHKNYDYKNYDYINDIFKSGNILFLQETWLHSFEHKLFTQKIEACQYHAISAMDDSDVGGVGRPFGAAVQLCGTVTYHWPSHLLTPHQLEYVL